jgi:hypothetical protein
MSLTAVTVTPAAVWVLTDSLTTYGDAPARMTGKMRRVGQLAITGRGVTEILDMVAAQLAELTLDEAEDRLGELVVSRSMTLHPDLTQATWAARAAGRTMPTTCEMILAGWSAKRGRMAAIRATMLERDPDDELRARVHVLAEGFQAFPGFQAEAQPLPAIVSGEQRVGQYMASMAESIAAYVHGKTGKPAIGGWIDLTTVTKDRIRTKRIGKFSTFAADVAAVTAFQARRRRLERAKHRQLAELADRVEQVLGGHRPADPRRLFELHIDAGEVIARALGILARHEAAELDGIGARLDGIIAALDGQRLDYIATAASDDALRWYAATLARLVKLLDQHNVALPPAPQKELA